jgi:hypothetical protein
VWFIIIIISLSFLVLSLSVVVQPLRDGLLTSSPKGEIGVPQQQSRERMKDKKLRVRLTLFACERIAQITDVSSHCENVVSNECKSITPSPLFFFTYKIDFMQMLCNV